MKKMEVKVRVTSVPNASGSGRGSYITAQQAEMAESLGFTKSIFSSGEAKGYYGLEKVIVREFPETASELEQWIEQENATNRKGEKKTLFEIIASYVDKFYSNQEASSLFARIQGKDSETTKAYRKTCADFGLNLSEIDAAIATSANPMERFSEDFWKSVVPYAVTGKTTAEVIEMLS